MKRSSRLFSAILALVLLASAMSLTGCRNEYKVTTEDNPLFAFEEVKEINETLKMPFILGEYEEELVKGGFESYGSSIEHHMMRYRSINNQDVVYTAATYELHYGTPDPSTRLYVTGFRIGPENRRVVKNKDGSTSTVYTTSRSVLGIKIGDQIADAKKKLLKLGYEVVFEEQPKEGMPPSALENSFHKGIIVISLGAESSGGEISQIAVWTPYYEPDISKMNSESKLPADLGLIFSVMQNTDFKYVGKNRSSSKYETEDGSAAIMRGFPDVADMAMTTEVSFVLEEYNVLGVKVGMSEEEAKQMLLDKGCKEESNGLFVYNSVAAVQLYIERGVVSRIAATLRASTNILNLDVDE